MLKLDGVHKKFKSALVAEKISVDLGPCTYGLLGRNGSGKTTLLRCITRVEKVNGGRIVYTDGDGREVKDYLDHIGYLPQNFDVFPELTAYEVLQFFANLKGHKITEAEITHLLEILSLSPQRDMTVKTLSGGMKRRLGIAQALIGDPDVLLLDEPTTALDVTIQAQILDVFRRIQKKLGMATVFISHDLGVVAGVADRVAVMYAGKIVEIGTAEEIFYDPRHPYTWGLLQSLPILSRGKEWLPTLPGMPPTLIHPPKGDAFAERNAYAMRIDYEKEPPMFQVTDTHYAATWLLDERAPKVKAPIGERRYGK